MSSADLPLPVLPTPDQFAFPYPQPYDIQLDLMRTVFRAIEERKIAIVESPTGTGKSLTLLTSTLSWLAANRKRLDQAAEDSLRSRLTADDPDDPPWVIEHALKSRLADLRAVQEAQRARLAEAREKERQRRKKAGLFRGGKRIKVDYESADGNSAKDGDEEFLPEDTGSGEVDEDAEGGNISKQVKELMAKYEAGRPKFQEEEKEDDVPKIYYTSRTHTQLRQLTAELLKTSFPAKINPTPSSNRPPALDEAADEDEGVSLVPLASRRQLCINPKVQALGKKSGDERMNEACLDMQKGGKAADGGARCQFLPKKDDEAKMLDMRDAVLATVQDIEDIVVLGKDVGVCPYYATRRAVKQSQLVTLPYNLLLQKNAREALDIDLTDQIVVIDEAHNLIDTLLSIHSTTLTASHISQATSQLTQYLSRFRTRLKPVHALWIRQTLSVLRGLQRVCEAFSAETTKDKGKGTAEMLDTIQLMSRLGGSNDQINLMEMVKYLRESKLARKVSGFAEKSAEEIANKVTNAGSKPHANAAAKHASIAAFHQVESFLLSLTDARDDGRIILSTEDRGGKPVVTLKYMLLNPAERFKEVVESARCVILAGGTMEPISDFMLQLFPSIPRDRFATLSCKHVIPKNNLLTQVVSMGPRKVEFEFKYANRGDDQLLAELGAVISSVIGMVPDGVVVFLPSYAFLDKVKAVWGKSGVLERLNQQKQIFYEPQTSSEVDQILRDYAHAISSSAVSISATPTILRAGASNGLDKSAQKNTAKGALLFAVVGGKLSEGINFSDSLGRCVIMVGLPFANVGSVELKERMRYVEGLPGAGKDAAREMYENLCMRAVNQSIGRAIRHANDYATILLVDKRYASHRIRSKLPKWIGEDVQVPQDFAGVAKGIAGFFREKRERGLK